MARIAVCVYSLAACSLLLAGCQSGRKQATNPFTRGTSIARRDAEESDPVTTRPLDRAVASQFEEGSIVSEDTPELATSDPESTLAAHELAHLPEEEQLRIQRNLATMDPASAKIVVRTIRASNDLARRTRTSGGAEPEVDGPSSLAAAYSGRNVRGLIGGHSLGRTRSDDVLTDNEESQSDARTVEGIGEVSAWNDERSHTTYRPGPERWPGPQTETAPLGTLDRLTGHLSGVLPTAASNGSPSVVTTSGNGVPEFADPRGPHIGTLAFESPSRTAAATPANVPTDRTMSGSFDTSPPLRRALTVGTAATSDGTTPLELLIDQLERDTRDAQPGDEPAARLAYVERHVFLRLLYIAAGDDRAFVAIPGLPPAEQTFWTNYLFATANYLDAEGIPDPHDRAGQTVGQLRSAILALQADARLELRNVGFCKEIHSFGNYEPLESTQLRPGAVVLVYAEVENFRSETTADGHYRTLLRSTIEFYRPDGTFVSTPIDFKPSEERTRNHRRDYFLAFTFQLPQDLPPGAQSLKVVVTDELSKRIDTHTLNFTVMP